MTAAPRIFIVAGEVSGDHQAALLAAVLRQKHPGLAISGVGGDRMRSAGVDVLLDTTRWGVIGYLEAYSRLPLFALRFWKVVRLIEHSRPDLLVLVDFPGMNRELVRHFSGRVPMVYFFPPQTYGRRGRSAERMAGARVRLLAVLPFEAESYQRAGADVVFVGHPAVDAAAAVSAPPQRLREDLGIGPGLLVGLLPGSRVQEVRSLLPPMLDAARQLHSGLGVQLVLPMASSHLRPEVQAAVAAAGLPVRLVEGRPLDVMRASDAIVMASGTASVEATCIGVPMVVLYRLSPVTWWIGSHFVVPRWVLDIGISIPSILLGRKVVPELLQGAVTGERIEAEVKPLLTDPAARSRMLRDLEEARGQLGAPGALDRAATEVLRALDSRRGGTVR